MGVNFNLAMLRNLQEPIEDSLETAIAQLSQYAAGTLSAKEMEADQHIHLVSGSLTVIGCHAAARLSQTLEDASGGLARPDRRGWDGGKARQVAGAALQLAEALLEHLQDLLTEDADPPVRMWPQWVALTDAMDVPQHTPEDLFEPDSDFQDQRFALLANDYLQEVCDGMIQRMEQAIEQISSATDADQTIRALREALKVFDQAYGLRHSRGYQAYWLALRARLSVGLMGEDGALDDRAQWSTLLREALLELNKLSRNTRRVSPDLLMKTIRPLLVRWPEHWVSSHPILAEANRRLGLHDFWINLDEVSGRVPSATPAASGSVPVQEDQAGLVEQLRKDWIKYVAGEGADPRTAMAKDMALLSSRHGVLTDQEISPLLDEIASVGFDLPDPGRVPEELGVEFAAAVLLLEDLVERRGRHSPFANKQYQLQSRRLAAARKGNLSDLNNLPRLRWDPRRAERQVRLACAAAFAEIHKDIQVVEDALAEQIRARELDEKYDLDLDGLRLICRLSAAVLRALGCPSASAIVDGLAGLLGKDDEASMSAVTLGVAGVSTYLSAQENGDADAEILLEAAHHAVLGEALPTGTMSQEEWERTQKPIEEHVSGEVHETGSSEPENVAEPPNSDGTGAEDIFDELTPSVSEEDDQGASEPARERFDPKVLDSDQGYVERRLGAEIEDFFLEEMDQVMAEVQAQRALLSADPTDKEAFVTLRRQFHTIKGSARLAGFHGLGEMAYWLEARLDRDIEQDQAYGSRVDSLVAKTAQVFSGWFRQLQDQQPVTLQAAELRQWLSEADSINEDSAEKESQEVSSDAPDDQLIEQDQQVPEMDEASIIPAAAQDQASGGDDRADANDDHAVVEDQSQSQEEVVASAWPRVDESTLSDDGGGEEPSRDESSGTTSDSSLLGTTAAEAEDEVVEDAIVPLSQEVDENEEFSAIENSEETPQGVSDGISSVSSPQEVEVDGFGVMGLDVYGLLVQDLSTHRPVLATAASTATGEMLQVEPVLRAAHTLGSLGGTMEMSSLGVMGRAFEEYVAALAGQSETMAWSELGQEGAEALWMLADDLIERQRLGEVNTALAVRLGQEALEASSASTREVSEQIDAIIPGVGDDQDRQEQGGEGAPIAQVADEPAADASSLDDVYDEEDQLWVALFESLETVSSELRRIGPILAALSERRR